MTVFADAFFYIALLSKRDEFHVPVLKWVAAYKGRVVTSEWILLEVGNALAGTLGRRCLRQQIHRLRSEPSTKLVEVSSADFEQALALYDERPDKKWSLTDCLSFLIMKRERISEALTRDHHFGQAGFVPLFAE